MRKYSIGLPETAIGLTLLLAFLCGPSIGGEQGDAGMKAPLAESVDRDYTPNPEAIAVLQQIDRPVEIVLFHGAWCKDCQREVPRFMRILEMVGNPLFHLEDYEVNPQKRDALGKFEEYGIKFVPTIIFLREGKELGRIVERPRLSLEDDFAAIVKGMP